MDISEIKTLTGLMVENDLTEIMIRDGERRIIIRRGSLVAPPVVMNPAPPPPAAPAGPAPPASAAAVAPDAGADRLARVTSPMVGTYYASPGPDAPPFVRVGDRVGPDTIVCIIEAMKVFNEIKAEVAGVIESIDVQNGAAVEYGQVLMRVRPAG
jgi:acetyl-CoA carboxylase biotin carboxyl carrier protein